MPSIVDLEGTSYGPAEVRTCLERVGDFISVTGDDPTRWQHFVPPSYGARFLFGVAPALLEDPVMEGRSILHADQRFEWHRAVPYEWDFHVTGSVEKFRERGGSAFVSFQSVVEDPHGEPYLTSRSTFLLTPRSPEEAEDRSEPPPELRGENHYPRPSEDRPLLKSASRADLVRYAGATGDWNPVHWDHQVAREAGLAGVVCHGLLLTAWLCQAACRLSDRPAPLAELQARFRQPVFPAEQARIRIERDGADDGRLSLALSVDGEERVSGRAQLRRGNR